MRRDPHGPPDLGGEYEVIRPARRRSSGWSDAAWVGAAVATVAVLGWALSKFLEFWSGGR
ncbi:MAG TPA: hypothetical protein VEJ18_10535 [Planctomycetota bacterium]|nr:hypothetical protein [Planctomycetota bacterium]